MAKDLWNVFLLIASATVVIWIFGWPSFGSRTQAEAPAPTSSTHPVNGFGESSVVPENVRRAARDALELFYIQSAIYSPVRCNGRDIDAEYLVRCGPSDRGVPGGLFIVKGTDPRHFSISAVNGRAIQHLNGKPFPDTGASIELHSRWDGKAIDIPFALKVID